MIFDEVVGLNYVVEDIFIIFFVPLFEEVALAAEKTIHQIADGLDGTAEYHDLPAEDADLPEGAVFLLQLQAIFQAFDTLVDTLDDLEIAVDDDIYEAIAKIIGRACAQLDVTGAKAVTHGIEDIAAGIFLKREDEATAKNDTDLLHLDLASAAVVIEHGKEAEEDVFYLIHLGPLAGAKDIFYNEVVNVVAGCYFLDLSLSEAVYIDPNDTIGIGIGLAGLLPGEGTLLKRSGVIAEQGVGGGDMLNPLLLAASRVVRSDGPAFGVVPSPFGQQVYQFGCLSFNSHTGYCIRR